MHVIVYVNEGMDQGYVYLARELDDHEIMCERTFAEQVAADHGTTLDTSGGHIPNCCGDIRVEFIEHEPNIIHGHYQGSVDIWSGESFYFAQE